MRRDIANYFIGQSKAYRQVYDLELAFYYLKQATEIWYQYYNMDKDNFMNSSTMHTETYKINEINKLIKGTMVLVSDNGQNNAIGNAPHPMEIDEENLTNIEILYLYTDTAKRDAQINSAIDFIFGGLNAVKYPVTEFNQVEQCLNHIQTRQNKRIGLILLHAIGRDEVMVLERFANVDFIFQLDAKLPWLKKHALTCFSSSKLLIIQRLCVCHELLHSEVNFCAALNESTESSAQEFTQDNRSLVLFQLLIEILLRTPITERCKNDFIELSLEQYSSNLADRNVINSFASTFKPNGAIMWYTMNSFVYRTLNRALRDNNLRSMYKSRYFICHLYDEIKKRYTETCAFMNSQISVYRGRIMSSDELRMLRANTSKVITTKCFLSATFDQKVAVAFSGMETKAASGISVIFRLIIDAFTNRSVSFAPIQNMSAMKDEAEVLILPGTIFQVKSVVEREVRSHAQSKINLKLIYFQKNAFDVVLIHTLEQQQLEEKIRRPKSIYLDRARTVTSFDDFEALVKEASSEINEQELLLTPTIHNKNEKRLTKKYSSSLSISRVTSKRLWKNVSELRSSNTRSDGSIIFIVDETPFDDDNEDSDLLLSNSIICRLFPRQHIYKQYAFKIAMCLSSSYPFSPPTVYFLTPIYHPNVGQNGNVCLDILQNSESWKFNTSLVTILISLVDLIDTPNIDEALRTNIAVEYIQDRAEFNRKALVMAKKHALPR
ncbi:unnamed protein product [Adineta ricciae]|uniref:NAD(P)(+)--arginine ADP-ribosyltransferase n=1 Tax=Adineta ricciae TaxID=249248 RepID=A0A816F146_ADIRI|nr:unnamed protein product [Adineta ricciae]